MASRKLLKYAITSKIFYSNENETILLSAMI